MGRSTGFARSALFLGLLTLPAGRAPAVAVCLWDEVAKPVAADAAPDEWFGTAVSNSGDTVVVGAHLDGSPISIGAVYVFVRNAGGAENWGQVKKLTASDGAIGDAFGASLSISGDTVVVGAHLDDDLRADTGAAYVFARNAGGPDNWGQVKKLTASDPMGEADFGISVAISGDTVVVGADDDDDDNGTGAAYVFERDAGGAGNWGQVKKLIASDAGPGDFFGTSVSIDGDRIVVGAIGTDDGGGNSGSVYVFERNTGGADNWGEVRKLTAADATTQDLFGGSVSIHGDTLVVGAFTDDSPLIDAGSAYVFERNAGGADHWGQARKLTAAAAAGADFFGKAVSISGDTILVGANADDAPLTNSGSAYVFERNAGGSGNWGQVQLLIAADASADDRFGTAVSISGETGVVGAVWDDPAGSASGSAYVFRSACPLDGPGEASPGGDMQASRGTGSSIDVTFDGACAATGHAAYYGLGPIGGAVLWTGSVCGLGTSGTASFDPGVVPPGQWLYFVIVGHNGLHEGGYGGRPEAVGIGLCDRPEASATCE